VVSTKLAICLEMKRKRKNHEELLLDVRHARFFIPGFAQIVIDETDMPKEADTLRVSLTTTIPGDYTQTGSDITWDFSGSNKTSQQVNSFVKS
jgi:hypothetical protein